MVKQLCETIVEKGIQNTNFFNGRLLSAEDLQVEQLAQRQHRALLGRAIGAGVVRGLEVELDFKQGELNHTLLVRDGLAINAEGQALHLSQQVKVAVAPETPADLPTGGLFGLCTSDNLTLPTGIGLYLLLLAPASDFSDYAPMSGLGQNGQITGCGRRYKVDGVCFKLVKLNLTELGLDQATVGILQSLISKTTNQSSPDAANLSLLRNRIAHLCFGSETLAGFARDPFARTDDQQSRYNRYGLLDALADLPKSLFTSSDVPLALVYWTERGLRFVDNWSVRRRPYVPLDVGPWSVVLGERRQREAEAMFLQFEEHIEFICKNETNLGSISAVQRFDFLPPVGLLPITATSSPDGFNSQTFFGALASRDLALIDGSILPDLWHKSFYYPPINLSVAGKIQQYLIWENVQAIKEKKTSQLVLVFASQSLPYCGVARFGYAKLNLSRFAPVMI